MTKSKKSIKNKSIKNKSINLLRSTKKKALYRSSSNSLTKKYTKIYNKGRKLSDDFYTHVNYEWMKTHVIPKDKGSTDAFVSTQHTVDKELIKLTKNIIHDNSPNSKRIKALYDSTMQWNNELVMTQIYQFLEQLNNIRKEETNLYLQACKVKKFINQKTASYV